MSISPSRALAFRPWLLSVVSTIAVFEFLAAFAWRTESGRLFDPALMLVAFPAGAFALILLAALLLAWFARVPLPTSLQGIARMLPFAWGLPLVDLIRSFGNGVVVGMPKFGGSELIAASLTGGLLPIENGLAIGARFGIFAGALILAIAVWHFGKSIVRAAASFLIWSAVAVHLAATLAATLFWRSPFSAVTWSAEPFEVSRRLTTLLSNGYWWNSIYERFITSIAAQTDVAGGYAVAAFALILLGVLLILAFVTQTAHAKRMLAHAYFSWGAFDLALYAGIGIGGAFVARALPNTGNASALSAVLFALMILVLRFGAVMKRDLFRLGADERDGVKQPIASGLLAPDDARAFADLSVAYVLAAAWILGWPVFAPMLAYFAASRLTRDRSYEANAWATAAYRAAGAGALAFASLAFVSQEAKVTVLALTCAGIAAGHRLFVELVWMPRVAPVSVPRPASGLGEG